MFRVLFAAVLLFAACHRNSPPSQPILFGPTAAWPGDTLSFWVQAADPDHDQVSYLMLWQDGSDSTWSDWFPPAYQYRLKHVFPDTGQYPVIACARDAGAESVRSDTLLVSVAEFGPNPPRRPAGPDTVAVNDTVGWVTAAYHQLAKPVAIRLDFGDTLGEWSEFVTPGTDIIRRHSYARGGIFAIRAQARDEREHLSDWSVPETVTVVDTFNWR